MITSQTNIRVLQNNDSISVKIDVDGNSTDFVNEIKEIRSLTNDKKTIAIFTEFNVDHSNNSMLIEIEIDSIESVFLSIQTEYIHLVKPVIQIPFDLLKCMNSLYTMFNDHLHELTDQLVMKRKIAQTLKTIRFDGTLNVDTYNQNIKIETTCLFSINTCMYVYSRHS